MDFMDYTYLTDYVLFSTPCIKHLRTSSPRHTWSSGQSSNNQCRIQCLVGEMRQATGVMWAQTVLTMGSEI